MTLSVQAIGVNPVHINRFLRRGPLQQVVLGTKAATLLFCLVILSVTLYDFLQNQILAATASMKLGNELASLALEKSPESVRRKRKADSDIAVAKNLFGDLAPKAAGKDMAAAKPVPQTQLTLIGTFIAGDVHESYAIIEDQKKKVQEDFAKNELIFGEARLVAIFPDKVEIERNGNREFLRLDETADASGSGAGEGGLPVDEFVVNEGELETALQNLPLLLTQARAVPYFKGGQSIGLRLFAIKTGSLYEKVGLKNGDILKAINSNSLSDITQAAKLFEMLKQEKSISVSVERNREDRVFRYQIK